MAARPVQHETGSVEMLRYMLKDNKIDLSAYDPPLRARDVTFIEEMILGTPERDRKGRGVDKEFLYDIVNNTRYARRGRPCVFPRRHISRLVITRSIGEYILRYARCVSESLFMSTPSYSRTVYSKVMVIP